MDEDDRMIGINRTRAERENSDAIAEAVNPNVDPENAVEAALAAASAAAVAAAVDLVHDEDSMEAAAQNMETSSEVAAGESGTASNVQRIEERVLARIRSLSERDDDSSNSNTADLDMWSESFDSVSENLSSPDGGITPPLEHPISPDPDAPEERPDPSRWTRDASMKPFDEDPRIAEIVNKTKLPYGWNTVQELMSRENGLQGPRGQMTAQNGSCNGFTDRLYSSRHIVEQFKISHCLRRHTGCVNCLNFSRSGDLLCSGSDDRRLAIWDWRRAGKPLHVFKSGHTQNIFQAKFANEGSTLKIISGSRDGQVRQSIIHPAGGKVETKCLYKHTDSVHKLVLCPQQQNVIISVGEDGYIRQHDMREHDHGMSVVLKIVKVGKRQHKRMRLFSISHNPFKTEICVCGNDNFVRVFDTRNMKTMVHEMCPQNLKEIPLPQITCSVYNYNGTEILASYSDDNIYLFDNKNYKPGEYLHAYKGHFNQKTIKGVNFYGRHSEFIISGSDCGRIFMWEKDSEAIVNFGKGDRYSTVNCLEPHPIFPMIATSGLDHDVKLWAPLAHNRTLDPAELKWILHTNLQRSVMEEAYAFDSRHITYFIRRFIRPTRMPDTDSQSDSSSAHSNSDSSDSSNGSDVLQSEAAGHVDVGGGADVDPGVAPNLNIPMAVNAEERNSANSSGDDNLPIGDARLDCRTQ